MKKGDKVIFRSNVPSYSMGRRYKLSVRKYIYHKINYRTNF